MLYGFMDTRCRFVVKMRVVPDDRREDILNGMRSEAEKIATETD